MATCQKCGASLPEGVQFCGACGAKAKPSSVVSAQQPVPPPPSPKVLKPPTPPYSTARSQQVSKKSGTRTVLILGGVVAGLLLVGCIVVGLFVMFASGSNTPKDASVGGVESDKPTTDIIGTWDMEVPEKAAKEMKMTYAFKQDGSIIRRVVFDRRKSLENTDNPDARSLLLMEWKGDLSVQTIDTFGTWKLMSPGTLEVRYTGTTDPEGLQGDERTQPERWEDFAFAGEGMKATIHLSIAGQPQQQRSTFRRMASESKQGGAPSSAPEAEKGEGATSTQGRELKGATFTGIVIGDFVHLEFKSQTGEDLSFFQGAEGIDYFLVLHKEGPMDIRVAPQMLQRPGADEQEKVEAVVEVSAGGTTFTQWWSEQKAKISMEEIRKTYDPLVEKYTQ